MPCIYDCHKYKMFKSKFEEFLKLYKPVKSKLDIYKTVLQKIGANLTQSVTCTFLDINMYMMLEQIELVVDVVYIYMMQYHLNRGKI